MLFNSLEFLLFFPIVLLAYGLLAGRRTLVLLAASYFFYGWWNWAYLGLMLLSTAVDYFCAQRIEESDRLSEKRTYLAVSLVSNLGVLFFFKYFNFFNAQVAGVFQALGMDYLVPYSSLLLPMGISFYTFQTISYTVDVYRGHIKAERDPLIFALYVSFFPQLVAGPIERAGHLLGQLKVNREVVSDNIVQGLGRVLVGLFKKVVIADRLALFVNQVYGDPTAYDGSMLIVATVFFAFQIYCDFSGYSDMAIGLARMFGVDLMENFRNPYLAHNIRQFWSHWHISLSTWFRDYVYIPLGGNKRRMYRNLIVVFVVSGLWHGASWTFILWGAAHGTFLIVSAILLKRFAFLTRQGLKPLGVVLTFSFVCFTWILFRANSLPDAVYIISHLTDINKQYLFDLLYQGKIGLTDISSWSKAFNLEFGKLSFQYSVGDLILSGLLIPGLVAAEHFAGKKAVSDFFSGNTLFAAYFVLILAIILFGVFSDNQFIYFQF